MVARLGVVEARGNGPYRLDPVCSYEGAVVGGPARLLPGELGAEGRLAHDTSQLGEERQGRVAHAPVLILAQPTDQPHEAVARLSRVGDPDDVREGGELAWLGLGLG